jgi:hypothetical protein
MAKPVQRVLRAKTASQDLPVPRAIEVRLVPIFEPVPGISRRCSSFPKALD